MAKQKQDEDQDEGQAQDEPGEGQDEDEDQDGITLEEVNQRLIRLEHALSGGKVHKRAEKVTQDRLAEPGDVTDQVKAELDRRDEAAKRQQREAELGQLKEDVAKLRDAPPKAPLRKITRWMVGRDD